MPGLDRVFAFPTTIFVRADGRVKAVHTGFTGPGTGDEFENLLRAASGNVELAVERRGRITPVMLTLDGK